MSLSDFPWLRLGNITQRKGSTNTEGGIDIGLPAGTPVTALCSGEIVGAGNFYHPDGTPGYGVVTIRCNVPGMGKGDLYYQHIAISPGINQCVIGGPYGQSVPRAQCKGQTVQRGQLLGWSKNPPGDLEIGLNPPWYGVWGPSPHPGPWVDPEIYLKNLANMTGSIINNLLTGLSGQGDNTSSAPPVPGTQFFNDILNKALLFLVALTLIGAGFYLLAEKQINSAIKKGASVAVKAALV